MKTVLITGADQGMGLGYVRHYLKVDCVVVGTFRAPDETKFSILWDESSENLRQHTCH